MKCNKLYKYNTCTKPKRLSCFLSPEKEKELQKSLSLVMLFPPRRFSDLIRMAGKGQFGLGRKHT
jgi:hypothetical protein